MADRAAKDALFDAFASVAKALGNGRRAEIVDVLAQGERSVEDLADEIGQSVANTSHHLRRLARAGAAHSRRDGTTHLLPPHQRPGRRPVGGAARRRRRPRRRPRRLADAYLGAPRRRRGGQPRRARTPARARATSSCSTSAPPPSTRPATSPAPVDPHRPSSPPAATRSPATPRSSPTAAAPTASTPTTRCSTPQTRLQARRLEDGYPEWQRAGLPVASGQ